MNLFQHIIELVIKKYHHCDLEFSNNHSKMFALYPMYFFTAHNATPVTKYEALRDNILENKYLAEQQKKLFFNIFSRAQKIYYALTRIIQYYKFKKTKLFDMECDIRFNPLTNFPESQKIMLIHYNTRYIFRLSDLCKIWKDSLLNCNGIKPDPILPYNPFIRKNFAINHLYAIYFKLRETDFKIPLCIQGFFKYGFDLDKYKYNCYSILKDHAIDNYFYNNSSVISKLYDIVQMLRWRKEQIGDTYISEYLSWEEKKKIVDKLDKFLILHLYATESCNPIKRRMYEDKCSKQLIDFFKKNPTFCKRQILWPRRGTGRRDSILPPLEITPPVNTSNNIIQEIDNITRPIHLPNSHI